MALGKKKYASFLYVHWHEKKLKLGALYFSMLIGKILISYYFETKPLSNNSVTVFMKYIQYTLVYVFYYFSLYKIDTSWYSCFCFIYTVYRIDIHLDSCFVLT
jgi:hypothetical protein